MKSLLEVEKISENLHLKNFKRSYQKSVPPKMSTFESFISVENLISYILLEFLEISINTKLFNIVAHLQRDTVSTWG